jgi:hypothetical protein
VRKKSIAAPLCGALLGVMLFHRVRQRTVRGNLSQVRRVAVMQPFSSSTNQYFKEHLFF